MDFLWKPAGRIYVRPVDILEDGPLKKKLPLILVIIACSGGLAWWFLRGNSPEKQVIDRFDSLAETVHKKSGETGPILALKSQRLPDYFDDKIEIIGQVPFLGGKHSAEELSQMIINLRMQAETASIKFYDMQVEFPAADQAKVQFKARASGRSKYDSGTRVEAREMAAILVKTDGKWRIKQFEVIKVIE